MVKAEYLGISEEPLRSGKVYKISTRCTGNKLVVSVRGIKRSYSCTSGRNFINLSAPQRLLTNPQILRFYHLHYTPL